MHFQRLTFAVCEMGDSQSSVEKYTSQVRFLSKILVSGHRHTVCLKRVLFLNTERPQERCKNTPGLSEVGDYSSSKPAKK
jgi:hypothetical protein